MFEDNMLLVIFLSILVIVFIVAFYKAIKNYKRFTCPKCGHKQNKSKETTVDKHKYIDNGRKTNAGNLDKRYNTTFRTNKIIHYQVECESCSHSYEHVHDRMKEKIDNDPVMRKLDNEMEDHAKSFIPRIRKIRDTNPELFKKMQDLGIIDKDFE